LARLRVLLAGEGSWATDVADACHRSHDLTVLTSLNERLLPTARAFGASLGEWALARGLACHLESVPPAYSATVWNRQYDVLVTSNWRSRIPTRILDRYRFGGVNIHRGALPEFAGLSPINWAVARGVDRTAVTGYLMDDTLDAGLFLSQEEVEIGQDDTATDVYLKTREIAPRVALRCIVLVSTLQHEALQRIPRPRCLLPYRGGNVLRIDWRRGSSEVYNLVRAQSPPFPSAYFRIHDKVIEVVDAARSRKVPDPTIPGYVFEYSEKRGSVHVACGAGSVEVRRLRISRSSEVGASTFLSYGDLLR